jgi:hypothetical protein
MVTPVTVILGSRAFHAATDADVGVAEFAATLWAFDTLMGTVTVEPLTPSLPPPQPNSADEISAVSPSRISVRFI